ncbi:ABC transporter permease [Acetanaerobacterium elongatum]|uniref:NitT/TauT family transport system permease protein n=1 Tax=Acetanaerobacterium elongatum TaxID=258515 RepID=A0A1H0AKJ8_9FIRM|nr:ABC transporter permease [Acetanaerobacterium elongatum]SDN34112.1 NitT/TauT family transport system permease protein [Acetanaerobacterium elongatum]
MFRRNKVFIPEASPERQEYIKQLKTRKRMIAFCRAAVLMIFIVLWEVLANIGVLDSFIMSQPSRIVRTFANISENGLLHHVLVTCYETVMGFVLGTLMGTGVAILLWWSGFLAKVSEPFLVVLNSLPKVALGPVIIIWAGAGEPAIIVMALAISLIVTILEMLNGFRSTSGEKIKMAKTFGANKSQVFIKIVLPSNMHTVFNTLKVNIGLSLVGVISGEFLVSKAGLGYLIVYGGQVFQMDLVMTSVLILAAVAAVMYEGVVLAQKAVEKAVSHTA